MSDTVYVKLKKLVKQLEKMKGRHTELVSVYIPKGFSLNEINNLLSQEISLTQNVRDKTVRKNVISALTKIQQHLKLYKKTPENGLAIFCGNVSEKEGVADIKLWAIEPPEPISVKIYWCDQNFELAPLREQLKEKEVYGLIVLDTKEASIGLLKGKNIQVLKHMQSIVPGKFRKGGQSSARFQRVREGLVNDWYKNVAEIIKSVLPKELKGIILGGPGIIKEDFYNGNYLDTRIKKKIIGLEDTGDTSESGLHELVEKSKELLKESKFVKEKELCKTFFDELQKDSGLVTYGIDSVLKALEKGAVETILISEDVEWKEVELLCSCGFSEKRLSKGEIKCSKCGGKADIVGEQDIIDYIEELAKNYGTNVQIISRETREGEQLYQLGGVGAILRWKL